MYRVLRQTLRVVGWHDGALNTALSCTMSEPLPHRKAVVPYQRNDPRLIATRADEHRRGVKTTNLGVRGSRLARRAKHTTTCAMPDQHAAEISSRAVMPRCQGAKAFAHGHMQERLAAPHWRDVSRLMAGQPPE